MLKFCKNELLLEQSEYFFIVIAEWMTTLEIKQDVNVTELDGIV
jgi:hypothetical protein